MAEIKALQHVVPFFTNAQLAPIVKPNGSQRVADIFIADTAVPKASARENHDVTRFKKVRDEILKQHKEISKEAANEFEKRILAGQINFVWLETRNYPMVIGIDPKSFIGLDQQTKTGFTLIYTALVSGAEGGNYGKEQIAFAAQKFKAIMDRFATELPKLLTAEERAYFQKAVEKGDFMMLFADGTQYPMTIYYADGFLNDILKNNKKAAFMRLTDQMELWGRKEGEKIFEKIIPRGAPLPEKSLPKGAVEI